MAYTSAAEIYDELASFLGHRTVAAAPSPTLPVVDNRGAEQLKQVTKTSSDGVFHGSSSLS